MWKAKNKSQMLIDHLNLHFTNISRASDMPLSEQLNYPLPTKIERELFIGLSRSEILEKISYSKERSTFYLRAFNDPKSCEAEKIHFQKCCEYHTNKLLVWEVALEKLDGILIKE
jgi:hypothetical protein